VYCEYHLDKLKCRR